MDSPIVYCTDFCDICNALEQKTLLNCLITDKFYIYMYITLIILFLSAIFFMSGKVRSDLVALCALVLLIIFGILTPEEALTGFSNSVVIMMIGLFVVGGAIFQTGLAKMISSRI